jgi:hypothetical protein
MEEVLTRVVIRMIEVFGILLAVMSNLGVEVMIHLLEITRKSQGNLLENRSIRGLCKLTFSLKRPATIFIASYDDCWL